MLGSIPEELPKVEVGCLWINKGNNAIQRSGAGLLTIYN
jgi:hypothetical protein